MNLKLINGFLVGYQRQGNDKNGNPIYLINIWEQYSQSEWYNINNRTSARLDKYYNIRVQSYNISDTIQQLLDQIK